MDDILAVGIEAAREAGCYLRENFGGAIREIERKRDQSLATNIDKESERIIVGRIKRSFPGHGIIGEERGEEQVGNGYVWIIDPLDGTHNYIRGIGIFGVSIGVARGDDFVAGVIYLPVEDLLYVGEMGNGAYCNGRRISVSSCGDLADCTLSFDSALRHSSGIKLKILDELSAKIFNLRMFGASVRVLTYLAEGKLDATVEIDDHCWDFAGGACIIREAGGRLTDLNGRPLTYRSRGYVATNGLVHEQVIQVVQNRLNG